MSGDLKFGMFIEPRDIGTRYVYRLVDLDRAQNFEVAFELSHDVMEASYIDQRPWHDERCMFNLWEGLKRNSPGTFLDARNRGWIASSTPRHGKEQKE